MLKLEQHRTLPDKAAIDALEHWIALLPASDFEQTCESLPYGDFILRVCRRGEKRDRSPVALSLPNGIASQIAIAGAGDKTSAFNLLTLARRLVAVGCSAPRGRITSFRPLRRWMRMGMEMPRRPSLAGMI